MLKKIICLFFCSFVFAQNIEIEAQKDYHLLVEFEKNLLNQKNLVVALEQKNILLKAYENYLKQYPFSSFAYEVRLNLVQYNINSNPKMCSQLLNEVLQNGSNLQKERAALLKINYLAKPLVQKKTEWFSKNEKRNYFKLLYLKYLYKTQKDQQLLKDSQFSINTFQEEVQALQILSKYRLGQRIKGENQEKKFQKIFPNSLYLPFFQRTKENYQLCNRIAPVLVDTDLNQKPFSIKGYHGKVVFLHFWATWEPHCLEIFKKLVLLKKNFSDSQILWVSVSLDYEKKIALHFLKNFPDLQWIHLFQGPGFTSSVAKQYKLQQLPTFFLIDKTGKIRYLTFELTFIKEPLKRLIQE